MLIAGLTNKDAAIVNDAVLWIERLRSKRGDAEIMRLAAKANPAPPIYAYFLIRQIPAGNKAIWEKAVAFIKATIEADRTRTKDISLITMRGAKEPFRVQSLKAWWLPIVILAFADIREKSRVEGSTRYPILREDQDREYLHQVLIHGPDYMVTPIAMSGRVWGDTSSTAYLKEAMQRIDVNGEAREDCAAAIAELTGQPAKR